MPRYVAFLRAINVGGRVVKMDVLRTLFEGLGLSSVETFIASGNVLFAASSKDARVLTRRIEGRLRAALGFDVATFLRTESQVSAIARHAPFTPAQLDGARALNIGLLDEPLAPERIRRLMALETGIDAFHVHETEIYWLCQGKQSQSTFSNAVFEKTVGVRATFRSANTLTRLAALIGSRGD